MGLFNRGLKKIEEAQSQATGNISEVTSEKAHSLINELSGREAYTKKKVIDNLIAFTNVSGGTGASTIATNVAYTATRRGMNVIIVDLNIMCPIQHTYLNIKQEVKKEDLVSYLIGENSMSDSIDNTHAVNIIFANNRTLTDEINCNSKQAVDNLRELLETLRQYYDLIILDVPMRIDEMLANTALYMCDKLYVVWDEGISSIINTEKARRNMAISGIDSFNKMKVILNKKTSLHYTTYPLKKLNIELMGVLPFDIDIIDNSLRGRIFCEGGSSSSGNANKWVQEVGDLTDRILSIGGYSGKK